MSIAERIKILKDEIEKLQESVTSQELLTEVWHELGPYTPHLTKELRFKLQDHFEFDDSE